MESIEQMIVRLCPEGVEYKSFSEIGSYIRGITYNKAQENNTGDGEGWKVFRANNITLSSNTLNYDDVKVVQKSVKVKESQMLKEHDILICAGSGSKDHIGKVAYINENMEYTFGGFMGVLRANEDLVLSRYLFHVLTSKIFKDYLSETLNSSTINNLNSQIMNDFEFPLPPLCIQERLVEVLDKMTTLTAELEAELEARKQQYEYYRNKLLTFNEIGGGIRQVTWMKINEIGTIYRGIAYSKKDFTETGTPCIHYGQIYTRYGTFANKTFTYVSEELANGKRLAKKGDLVMAVTSENMEDVGKCLAWLGEDDILVSNHACFIRHSLNPKYLAYFLQTSYFFNYKKKISKGVKVIDLDLNMFGDMLIPVPSMEEQERIVSILDRFEALTTDLQIGLPAEIEARRQQYEYYRNKLLTFDQAV